MGSLSPTYEKSMSCQNYFMWIDVPAEQQCRRSPTGDEYLGNLSRVKDSDCEPWSSYSVLVNPYYLLGDNYCRNPMEFDGAHRKDKRPGPWCYTGKNGTLKQSTCDVRYCGRSFLLCSLSACSYQAKAGAKAKNIEEQSKGQEDQRSSDKNQRKISLLLLLFLSYDVKGP